MIHQRYLTILEDRKLTYPCFILLIFIYEEKYEFLDLAYDHNFIEFNNNIQYLEQHGLIKWHGDNPREITLRKEGEELFKKHVGTYKKVTTAKEVEGWIQSWRDIFPEGVNSGGYRYRGDKAECIKKMIKFVNSNDYSIEQIFQATKDYVERFSLKGYAYMQLAHYFIEKKGVGSSLNAECEGLTERTSNNKGEEINYGRSII